jgi:hypothetical protein
MTELCEVVITAPDPDWLKDFSRKLVEQRLCASAHNFAPVRSIYRWRGDIYERTEGRVSCTPGATEWQKSSPWQSRSTRMKCQAYPRGPSPTATRTTWHGSLRRQRRSSGRRQTSPDSDLRHSG